MIPLEIRLVSFTYSIIDYKKEYNEEVDNLAKEEIEKINIKNSLWPGDRVLRQSLDKEGNEYDTIWVYLGRNYFKQISKTLDNRTC